MPIDPQSRLLSRVGARLRRTTTTLAVIEFQRTDIWWSLWDGATEESKIRMAAAIARRITKLERQRLNIKPPPPPPTPWKRITSAPWSQERWARFGALVEAKMKPFEIAVLMGDMTEKSVRARRSEWKRGRRSSGKVGRKADPATAERWKGLGPMITAGATDKEIAEAFNIKPNVARMRKSRWLKQMGLPTNPRGRVPKPKVRHEWGMTA